MAAMPNKATKPMAEETLNAVPVTHRAKMPPSIAIGMTLAANNASRKPPKFKYNNRHDQCDRQRHGHAQAAHRVLQVAELADPFQMIAAGQHHLGVHGTLRLEYRTAEIAAAHAELDRHIALLLLSIDERRAGYQPHVRHVGERHRMSATARLAGAAMGMRRMASRFWRYGAASRTIIGKCRSLVPSYRSPALCPPIAACTTALMSPGARP